MAIIWRAWVYPERVASATTPRQAASSLAGSSIWDERGELILQLEPSGPPPGVGIAREMEPGVWQPVTRIMSLGSMEGDGVLWGQ